MNKELLLLIRKHKSMWIEQTKTKPQEALQIVMDKQMQTFSFNPSINFSEERKRLLAVTSFECTNSIFHITDENHSFSIIIPGHYQTESPGKTIHELNHFLEPRSLELHVKEVRKRGDRTKIGDNENKTSDFDTQKKRDT